MANGELSLGQRLISRLVAEPSDQSPATQALIRRLIQTQNKPEDFEKNPLAAIGQSFLAGADLLGAAIGGTLRGGADLAVKGGKAVGKAAARAGQGAIEQITGQPIPEAKTTEQGIAEAAPAPQQVIQQTVQAAEQSLSPIEKAQLDEAKKGAKAQVQEAGTQVGFDEVGRQILAKGEQRLQQLQPDAEQREPAFKIEDPKGLIGRLFGQAQLNVDPDTGQVQAQRGGLFSTASVEGLAKQAALVQELAGQRPLQKGDRERLALEQASDMAKTLATAGLKGLSPEQSAKFSLLIEGQEAVKRIDQMLFQTSGADFGSDISALRFTPDLFKSDRARQLQLNLETAVDNRVRAESGALLNQDELAREARKLMPRLNESSDTYKRRILRSFNFFDRALNIADPRGIHRQTVSGAGLGSPALQQFIAQEKARRGIQ